MNSLLLSVILFLSLNASADTWPLAEIERYYSENNRFFIEVIPARIPENYSSYLATKSKSKNLTKFKQSDTTLTPCLGTLYEVIKTDTIKVWSRQLINRIAPTYATVSDDGKFVVTFDNWANLGSGPNVFVIYNEVGNLLERYELDDITAFPMNSYKISLSSIWWFCGAKFKDSSRAIEICYTDKEQQTKYRQYNLIKLEFEY